MSYRQPFVGDWPISQRYGEKYTSSFHTGIDYACPVGTKILASADGQVMFAGSDQTGYGLCVIIRHNDGNATLYAHLSRIYVKYWQSVRQGDVIAESGNTGSSTGPHLHFEARRSWAVTDTHFDPMSLPLMSFADAGQQTADSSQQTVPEPEPKLKEADELGENVIISAPLGAWAWAQNFSRRETVYQQGTRLHFTGRTTERNGLTYCEIYPEPAKYWIAVHDGDCQIIDNADEMKNEK